MKFAVTATPGDPPFAPILYRGPAAASCAAASALGYDGIEWHLRHPCDVDAAALKHEMDRYGLGVPTIGTGLAAGQDGLTFADSDADVRRAAVERVREHLALAATLRSAVTIGLIWGRVGKAPLAQNERLDHALACLRACCEAAQAEGVTLLLEPLNRYESDYPQTLAQAAEIITLLGATNLRILADTFHMNIEEVDILGSLTAAAARLGHVHLADTNRQAPGHGHLDVGAVIGTLAQVDYGGWVAFEVLPLPSTKVAAADAIDRAHRTSTASAVPPAAR